MMAKKKMYKFKPPLSKIEWTKEQEEQIEKDALDDPPVWDDVWVKKYKEKGGDAWWEPKEDDPDAEIIFVDLSKKENID